MSNLIKILCENTNSTLFVREGATLTEILTMVSSEHCGSYIAAYVDNYLKDLDDRIFTDKSIRFVEISSSEGMRIYARSLFFILGKAISDIIPGSKLKVLHPVGNSYYCEISGHTTISDELLLQLKTRMQQLISSNLPLVKVRVEYKEALEMYRQMGAYDKVSLLETRPSYFVTMYNLAGEVDYFFGAMAPSTGYILAFDLQSFFDGLMVMLPNRSDLNTVEVMHLQPKLFDVFRQNKQWVDILGIPNIGKLNEKLLAGEGSGMIKVGEALQEKNFASIADMISMRSSTKLVLIAGPSSSGKTSFAKRLSVQLQVLGFEPTSISLDNYFVDRDATPRDENGEYDFECLEAVDVASFNSDLIKLMAGDEVELCKFNFHKGSRYFDGELVKLNARSILIVEGIHGLNPALIPSIDPTLVFKIYASALTTHSLDDMNVVRTTDNRLLRRMVRDSQFRSRPAAETLRGWPSVRRGEDRHIFPYQENADVMFGTALFFEIPILKKYAIPLLNQVPENIPEYAEALRLKDFLNCFVDMTDAELPPTSILREFIGGSSFLY